MTQAGTNAGGDGLRREGIEGWSVRIPYRPDCTYIKKSIKEWTVGLNQLAVRYELALENAQGHSREYFRNLNRSLYRMLGYRPRRTIVASGASTSSWCQVGGVTD